MNALPPAWLLQPITGEVFNSIEHCKRRLQNYALAEGFDVVQIEGDIKKVLTDCFKCLKHREYIKNWRKLKNHVKYNKKNTIITVYQHENILVSQINCKWSAYIS